MKKIVFCALVVLFSLNSPCFAAFNLAVEPYEGGYDLRLGKIDTQDAKVVREIMIRVTTDIGKQYRVFQRIDKPLTTPDGIEIDRNKFKMYTLINSNAQGTLERIEEFPVMFADTVLYTSNTAGDGDSFRVVYTFEPSTSQAAGSYQGRIQYVLIPIDSAQDRVVKTLNMYADLTNEGSVEISTEPGFKSIRISSKDLEKITPRYPTVFINIKGNLGTRYRIYQRLGDNLVRASNGDKFNLKKVLFEVKDKNAASAIKQGDLSELKSKSLVYASDDLGSGNEISIKFKPTKDFAEQQANVYTGKIDYFIELDKTSMTVEPGAVDAVDLEFGVEPVFRIIATSITDTGEAAFSEGVVQLSFGDVGYKSGSKQSKVKVRIGSNLGRPYLVTQRLMSALQNEEGDKIAQELFTFVLEKKSDTDAKLKFEQETIVGVDKDTPLFVSNGNGDSDEFEITYKLKTTRDTRGGTYTTGMSYSLSEL